MPRGLFSALGFAMLVLLSSRALSQERGAIALGEAVQGLGVNTRVLLIAAHPDDEDTYLISWLSRGRHVETAYLSLTRGDGGQNLIGNELGEALGVIRTEELLAARRVDGAEQFFSRAYDFGFSKDTIDTYKHWPRDSVLGDVIRVVRAFRPHVIVGIFSGTPRDGHGHHQVSALLARTAYDLAADTVRYPVRTYGPAWMPLKFYRNARYDPTGGVTLRFDVGEYSPLLGRSYAEIAGESRSQHRSQGFGAPQRKGVIFDMLRREATRVNESTPANAESSIFDGIDTTWARLRGAMSTPKARAALDSLPAAFAAVRAAYDPLAPAKLLPPLALVQRRLDAMSDPSPTKFDADLSATWPVLQRRFNRLLMLAAGVEVEAFAQREVYPLRSSARVVTSIYNRGSAGVGVSHIPGPSNVVLADAKPVAPGAALIDTMSASIDSISQPWWLRAGRVGSMFKEPVSATSETLLAAGPELYVALAIPGSPYAIPITVPVMYRSVDPVKGEIRQHVAGVPAITVTLDQPVQFARANTDFVRDFDVHLRSADEKPRDVRVTLVLPAGVTADSASRATRLAGYDATQTLTFRLRGRLPVGEHRISAVAESEGEKFATGYDLIDYDHIRRQRIFKPATSTISSVDMRVPATLRVAYVSGVGDNVAPLLSQLGIPVTLIAAGELTRADLQPYTTVVIGPRAYEAHPELVAANARLLEFARKGGTLLVQYGQYEMTNPGVMPYPITLSRPADRVTEEDAPVTIDAPNDKLLRSPNRIATPDFANWVQERALYMPHTFDERYHSLLSMNDAGEPPNKAAILVAPIGDGQYIYTTLSLFRQLPAGVPGGARLFVNLLSAGLAPSITP